MSYIIFLRLIRDFLSITQLLDKCYKVSFENRLFVIKDTNNLKVFKVHMKDETFALNFIKEELVRNKVNTREWSKLKEDRYLLLDLEKEKIDEKPHSSINQRFNMKFIIDKEVKLIK